MVAVVVVVRMMLGTNIAVTEVTEVRVVVVQIVDWL